MLKKIFHTVLSAGIMGTFCITTARTTTPFTRFVTHGYDYTSFTVLKNFLDITSHKDYKNLQFYQLDYDCTAPHGQRWRYNTLNQNVPEHQNIFTELARFNAMPLPICQNFAVGLYLSASLTPPLPNPPNKHPQNEPLSDYKYTQDSVENSDTPSPPYIQEGSYPSKKQKNKHAVLISILQTCPIIAAEHCNESDIAVEQGNKSDIAVEQGNKSDWSEHLIRFSSTLPMEANSTPKDHTRFPSLHTLLMDLYSHCFNQTLTFHIHNMKRSVVVYNYAASFFSTTPEEHFRGVQHIQKTLDASETWPIEKDTSYKIPLQTHRIWLTDATNPEEIPENQLAYYRESLTHYASDIQHHFWCLDCANIPLSIQKLQEMGVLIHTIDPDTLITKRLVQKLIADKLYGFASNLVRYEVLFQNGGLYTDIGLRQTRDLSYLFKKFDAIFYVQPTGEIDVRGMAFPKDSLFLKEHLTFIQQLPTLDCVQKSINLYGGSSQGITTGYILNAKVPIFALQHPEIRIGFFKENQDFTYHGMLKWKANWIKIFMKAHPLYFFDFSTY